MLSVRCALFVALLTTVAAIPSIDYSQCVLQEHCSDASRATIEAALEAAAPGADVDTPLCEWATDCTRPSDSAHAITGDDHRRGLKALGQATSTYLKMHIAARGTVAQMNVLQTAIRAGSVPGVDRWGWIEAHDGVVAAAPSTAAPPSTEDTRAHWETHTRCVGPCIHDEHGCSPYCDGGDVHLISSNSPLHPEVTCNCNSCGGDSHGMYTSYVLESDACAGATTQEEADECSQLVWEDMMCWALDHEEGLGQTRYFVEDQKVMKVGQSHLSEIDREAIHAGQWFCRANTVWTLATGSQPRPWKIAPTECHETSSSDKAYLGLLGLLGIIPLVLCLLLLTLCVRKQKSGDSQFIKHDEVDTQTHCAQSVISSTLAA